MAQDLRNGRSGKVRKEQSPEVNFTGFLNIYIDAEIKRQIKENPLTPEQQFGSLFKIINEHMSIQLKLEDNEDSYRALLQDRNIGSRTAGKMLSLHSKDFSRLLDLVCFVHFDMLGGDYSSLVVASSADSDF